MATNPKCLDMPFFAPLFSSLRGKRGSHPATNLHSQMSPPLMEQLSGQNLVIDVEGGLLRSPSTFPYFMLVAFEAGGFLRALLLLLLYPLIRCLSHEVGLRVMVMVCFFGLRKDSFRAGKAVLPKFFLEDVGLEGSEVLLKKGGKRICVSSLPRVMVEGFLKEYLEVEAVVGRELKVFCGYYTGLMETNQVSDTVLALQELLDRKGDMGEGFIGVSSSITYLQHPLLSYCKEIYLVTEEEKRQSHRLPRERYPRPLIFHDGRLAFRPTPMRTLAMFMWLPLGFILAFLRITIGLSLPFRASTPILAWTGMTWRLKGAHPSPSRSSAERHVGHLYVCNHRTLLDPIYVSIALDEPVTTVTYSLSSFSELLAPIGHVRLTRDREVDRRNMERLLGEGRRVVVCAEGTTCREPYLLRFSPLFAELSDEVVPVAVDVRVSMFHATTAGGLKCLDPLYYLMNPSMCYELEFLEKTDTRCVREGRYSSIDIANRVQREIGRALGFHCTKLTRKDKYLILAGNDGIVASTNKNRSGLKAS